MRKCTVQISAKDFKLASNLTPKEVAKNKEEVKYRRSTGTMSGSTGLSCKLNVSPSSRGKDSMVSVREQLPFLPPETLSRLIRAWTSDLETIFGCSWEEQDKLSSETYSRFDSITEAAKYMNEKYQKRDEYAKMADVKMAKMASRLSDLEKRTKHMEDLERRLDIAEKEIVSLRVKLQVADDGKRDGFPAPPTTGEMETSEAIEKASERLMRTMEHFEERVASHVKKYVELRLDPDGQQELASVQTSVPKMVPDGMSMEIPDDEGVAWTSVVGRRATPRVERTRGDQERGMRAVVPLKAVVSVRASGGVRKTAVELLNIAKEKIPVADIKADAMQMRESAGGGLVIEFTGEDGSERADAMAGSLRAVLGDYAVVSRPVKMATFSVDLT